METECRFASLASRLSVYGLEDRKEGLPDLLVQPGDTVELTGEARELQPHFVRLSPTSPYDLKRWIGIPDEVFERRATPERRGVEAKELDPCGGFIPHPPIDRENPEMQTNLYNFLFASSRGMVDAQMHSMNDYIDRSRITVGWFGLLDIYVSRHSRLVIDPKTQVLFARYIYVEETGVIEMQSSFAKIDCAGFRTMGRYVIGSNMLRNLNIITLASQVA